MFLLYRPGRWCEGADTRCRLGSAGGIWIVCGLWQNFADTLCVQQWAPGCWKTNRLRDKLKKIQPSHVEREAADGGRNISRVLWVWYVEGNWRGVRWRMLMGGKWLFFYIKIRRVKIKIFPLGWNIVFQIHSGESSHRFPPTLGEEPITLVLESQATDPSQR